METTQEYHDHDPMDICFVECPAYDPKNGWDPIDEKLRQHMRREDPLYDEIGLGRKQLRNLVVKWWNELSPETKQQWKDYKDKFGTDVTEEVKQAYNDLLAKLD